MALSSGDLHNRIELLQATEMQNELDETTVSYAPYNPPRKVWAKITPTAGSREDLSDTAERIVITHRITVRRASIKTVPADLRIAYRGQIYLLQYYLPNYRDNGLLELYCRLEVDANGKSY